MVLADRTAEPSGSTPPSDVGTGATLLFGLADALIDRHMIGIAVGIVAVERHQSPREALATLVRIAHRTDRSVVEVAHHLVCDHSHACYSVRPDRADGWDLDPAA
jgi:hypothetical protein